MTQEYLRKISINLITGAAIFALTAVGQAVHTYYTVKQQSKHLDRLDQKQKTYITNKSFFKYMELIETRNRYLKEGVDKNAENLIMIEKKIDRELAKIRESIRYKYRQ